MFNNGFNLCLILHSLFSPRPIAKPMVVNNATRRRQVELELEYTELSLYCFVYQPTLQIYLIMTCFIFRC